MTKRSIWQHLGDIPESYVTDALPPSWQTAGVAAPPKPRRAARLAAFFLDNGWVAAVLSAVVAIGLIVAIVLAGRGEGPVGPVGGSVGEDDTETMGGTMGETIGETRVDPIACDHVPIQPYTYLDEKTHAVFCSLCGTDWREKHHWETTNKDGSFFLVCSLCGAKQEESTSETDPPSTPPEGDFEPGVIHLGFHEPYTGSVAELFPDIDMYEVYDFWQGQYDQAISKNPEGDRQTESYKSQIGTEFIITLTDKTEEAVLSGVTLMKKHPLVKYARPKQIIIEEDDQVPSDGLIISDVWDMTLTPLPDPHPWEPLFPLDYLGGVQTFGNLHAARNDSLIGLDWENISAYSYRADTLTEWRAFYTPTNASADPLTDFNAAFFETHSLLVILREHSTGSLEYTGASAAVENGVLEIKLATYCPALLTDDMAYRLLFIPVEKSAADLPVHVEVTSVSEYDE